MNKRITVALSILILLGEISMQAQNISSTQARDAATAWLNSSNHQLSELHCLADEHGQTLAFVFELVPAGYLVLSADQQLPPVIAYSFQDAFGDAEQTQNPLQEMLLMDLGSRMKHIEKLSLVYKEKNQQEWNRLIRQDKSATTFDQWPPPGSTSTGGWLETNWSQSAPYNNMCPMDEVTGARSVAGCPAIALAMIINFQKNLNGTQFNDDDDYYHSYAGRQYWIDDDAHEMDFPSFPELNEYFDSISVKYSGYELLNTDEIAALIFACGVAARQVYTSEVSGTFGVDQAYEAYLRFGYSESNLVYDSDTSFYTQMKYNMIDGIPVHLAVLSNTGSGGHNVVADGYNTDNYYHLNFGWGGSYNGWYLLPDEIPYNLTIVEGAVMDIGITHVGIEEPMASNIINMSVYPNPSDGPFNVELEIKKASIIQLELRNINGSLIEVLHSGIKDEGKTTMHLNQELRSGIYMLSLSSEGLISNKKLIIR